MASAQRGETDSTGGRAASHIQTSAQIVPARSSWLLESARENIHKAQERMKKTVDKKRRVETFIEGDEVVISSVLLAVIDVTG